MHSRATIENANPRLIHSLEAAGIHCSVVRLANVCHTSVGAGHADDGLRTGGTSVLYSVCLPLSLQVGHHTPVPHQQECREDCQEDGKTGRPDQLERDDAVRLGNCRGRLNDC